ncbi:hypothetical protein VIN30_01135 [Adlercreutzia sp. R7]|uniref:Uncharacterized protein n=1 Tax=Adlercreutzia wanghongyangiae TaxID=3111451 RepID=A0ABU6IF44_9ACTN|nr:hypothetical protein [Adlercreutzia sp. R7]
MGFSPLLKYEVPDNKDLSALKSSSASVFRYGKEHGGVLGVGDVLAKAARDDEEYNKEFDALVEKWQPQLDASHKVVAGYAKKSRFFKLKTIPLFILGWFAFFFLMMVFSILGRNAHHSSVLFPLGEFADFVLLPQPTTFITVGLIVAYIVLKKRKDKRASKLSSEYYSLSRQAQDEVMRLTGLYDHQNSVYYREIDNLYLGTLDPVQREIVMMRRDQQRQHDQLMMEQQINAQRQREHEARVEREQAEIKRDQRRLLELEEKRMRGY